MSEIFNLRALAAVVVYPTNNPVTFAFVLKIEVSAAIVPLLVIVPPVIPLPVFVATEVTVPPLDGELLVIVKFGYVPLIEIPVPPVKATVWSGAVLVIVSVPLLVIGLPDILIPVPALAATLVTVPVPFVLANARTAAILSVNLPVAV